MPVSSMGALVPVPGQCAYGASKAAVKLLTEGLYAESRSTESSGAKLTSAADAGRQIADAVEKGSYRVCIGGDARMLDRLSRLMPQRATALVADKMKSLLDA